MEHRLTKAAKKYLMQYNLNFLCTKLKKKIIIYNFKHTRNIMDFFSSKAIRWNMISVLRISLPNSITQRFWKRLLSILLGGQNMLRSS